MENRKSLGTFWKKFSLIAGVIALCLALLFWLIFYANVSANIGWVIPVRKLWHERVIEPRQLLSDQLPYVIQTRGVSDGVYVYELWGRIENVDYTTYTMTLIDKRGNKWRVQMIHPPYHEANRIGIEIYEYSIERESGRMVGRAIPLTIDRRAPEQTKQYLAAGDMMSVVWREKVKLTEVLRRNRGGDYLVVVPGDITRPIRKVVGQ